MRVIVCGGRDYRDVPTLWKVLDGIEAQTPEGIDLLIDGASDDVTGPYVGADYWGHQWALARGVLTRRVHADWKGLGKKAGPIRNTAMLVHRPDLVVASPGGRGTADMVSKARAAGVCVMEIKVVSV